MDSTLSSFSLLILLSSLSLVFSQPQYAFPNHHFINCGSTSDLNFAGQLFVGDDNPTKNFSVTGGRLASDNTYQEATINRTARVFPTNSWYELEADENNTFVMVRFHFSPFTYNGFDLSRSKFNVSVYGFTLLSDFNVGATSVIRDFIIPIRSERKFKIEFKPSNPSSPAYVNAIEAFTTPSELFPQGARTPVISPAGRNGDMNNISSSYAFNPIYRINVGGQRIEYPNDSLRRIWMPDDPFIFNEGPASNKNFSGEPRYTAGLASIYDAPADVYKTAKQLNNDLVNITWNYNVARNTMYLVRAHFCDFISPGLNSSTDGFNFFINSNHKEEIQPGNKNYQTEVPFYEDFVVASHESTLLNISIGAIAGNSQPVILNGLEIMELLKNSSVIGSPTTKDGNGSKKWYVIVGCVVGGVALVLVLLVGFFIGSKYGKAKTVVGAKTESNAVPSYGRSSYASINIDFTINHPSPNLNLNLRFPFADIHQATNGFDESLMIGKGGFGKVYKGTLPDGMIVAVKRGEKGHGQGRPEFVTEILVLSKIRHHHLVTLIGYCDEKSEMILVYEFMQKGTLQEHLYDLKENYPKLSWIQRLEICVSATKGLHYLHTGAGIIHRDVKSTNILLNENYVAKVADFGISLLDNVDQSEIQDIKGSFGYLDPEYIRCMKLTQKSDVYSFGVVLLEVLCARPALDNTLPQREANLADWAIRQINSGDVDSIIDPFLVGTINPNSLRKFVEMVERCLKETGDERPSMLDVLWDLEYALKLQKTTVDKEAFEDSTMNTSLQLPMSMLHRLPSHVNDDSEVNHSSALSYPSESQVFSQLNMKEAR